MTNLIQFQNQSNELTEQEQLLYEVLQQKRINSLDFKLKEIENKFTTLNVDLEKQAMITGEVSKKIDDVDAEFSKEINKLNYDIKKQHEKMTYQKEITEKFYFSQAGLGAKMCPPIGSQYMGKLLRVVGICKKESSHTTPYSQYTTGVNPLCVTRSFEGIPTWVYHGDRTWYLIKNHLDKLEVYNDFSNKKTKSEIHAFIEELFNEYVLEKA